MCISIALVRGLSTYLGCDEMKCAVANIAKSVRCDMYENIVRLSLKVFDDNKSVSFHF